jgi:hypothetical protein
MPAGRRGEAEGIIRTDGRRKEPGYRGSRALDCLFVTGVASQARAASASSIARNKVTRSL